MSQASRFLVLISSGSSIYQKENIQNHLPGDFFFFCHLLCFASVTLKIFVNLALFQNLEEIVDVVIYNGKKNILIL